MNLSGTKGEDLQTPIVKRPRESLQFYLTDHDLELTPDGNYVRWACTNKKHPRNWTGIRKFYDTSLIIILDLFTTAVSTAGAPAAAKAREEFGIERTLSLFLFTSIYLLGQGLGSIVFPSYSESFGRKKLYVISTALYSIFCVLIAAVPSLAMIIVGRFVTGFLSAIPAIVVAGSIEDMFNSRDRLWLIFLWAMVANMGLVIGPIMSTFIAAELGWRWVFYVAAIVTGVIAILLLTIKESRPSLLLARTLVKVRKDTGLETLQSLNPDHSPDMRTFVRIALFRPLRLFFREPIVFMTSIMSAIAFALIYLFTEALPPIYESLGFSAKTSSLPFIAIGLGLISGLSTRIIDHRIIAKHHREGVPLLPEHKLTGFRIGAPVLAAALWWFAWTIPPHVNGVHWSVSAVSLFFIGYALNEFDAVLAGYLADSYLSYAASGFAALSLTRSLLSASFPLFATQMFSALSANIAVSVLASMATLFCIVPPLFMRYGEQIRGRSEFAKYSLAVYSENTVDKEGY